MAIEVQADLKLNAKNPSSLLFTPYGEAEECIHREMLHARATTSGTEREDRTWPLTVYLQIYVVLL